MLMKARSQTPLSTLLPENLLRHKPVLFLLPFPCLLLQDLPLPSNPLAYLPSLTTLLGPATLPSTRHTVQANMAETTIMRNLVVV